MRHKHGHAEPIRSWRVLPDRAIADDSRMIMVVFQPRRRLAGFGLARSGLARFAAALAASAVALSLIAINVAEAAGDPVKGAAAFVRQCALCHTSGRGERNGFGPNLFGITARKAGTAPGYEYSGAFKAVANWTWSPDSVRSFIIAPAKVIPGNKMAVFQGVADRDLDDLIAFLETQK